MPEEANCLKIIKILRVLFEIYFNTFTIKKRQLAFKKISQKLSHNLSKKSNFNNFNNFCNKKGKILQ